MRPSADWERQEQGRGQWRHTRQAGVSRDRTTSARRIETKGRAKELGMPLRLPPHLPAALHRERRTSETAGWPRNQRSSKPTQSRFGAMVSCCLTFDMSGGPKGAKRPLERPLDGGVRSQYCTFNQKLPTIGVVATLRRAGAWHEPR